VQALDAVVKAGRDSFHTLNLASPDPVALLARRLCDNWAVAAWSELLSGPRDSDLEEGGLILSQWANPLGCDPAAVRAQIDHLADVAREHLGMSESEPISVMKQIKAVNYSLFTVCGLHGANDRNAPGAYYDQRNSFLSEVLKRKVGIPISLGTVFAAVARRIGLKCGLLAEFPCHVLVRVFADQQNHPACSSQDDYFVDAFHQGNVMQYGDLRNFAGMQIDEDSAAASRAVDVYARMMRNLASIYEQVVRGNGVRTADGVANGDVWKLLGICSQLQVVGRQGEMQKQWTIKRLQVAACLPPKLLRLVSMEEEVLEMPRVISEILAAIRSRS